nr:hypothetical protein [Synechococcus sp. PCC 6312]
MIYLGLHNLSQIHQALLAAGRNSETPMALIQAGTRPEEKITITTLGAEFEGLENTKTLTI